VIATAWGLNSFFPSLVSPAFITGLRIAFAIGAVLSLLAAATSLVPGESRAARRAARRALEEADEPAMVPVEVGGRAASWQASSARFPARSA
jgi:hypothetical protein